jgi:hypothetical protein
MVITDELFEAFIRCETKAYLNVNDREKLALARFWW